MWKNRKKIVAKKFLLYLLPFFAHLQLKFWVFSYIPLLIVLAANRGVAAISRPPLPPSPAPLHPRPLYTPPSPDPFTPPPSPAPLKAKNHILSHLPKHKIYVLFYFSAILNQIKNLRLLSKSYPWIFFHNFWMNLKGSYPRNRQFLPSILDTKSSKF